MNFPLCKCGCGVQVARKNNQYVNGHNGRNLPDGTKSRVALSRIGKHYPKLSEAKKNAYKDKTKNPMYGKHFSEEAKNRLRQKAKTPERIATAIRNLRNEARTNRCGWHHSEETKKKLSELHKRLYAEGRWKPGGPRGKKVTRRPHSREAKEKMRRAKLGKSGYKHSPEAIEKMRKSKLGKPRSEETKDKLRMSHLGMKHPGTSVKVKALWQDPEYVSKQMRSRHVMPNRLEIEFYSLLDNLYPEEWKYVGDGQLIIGGKCPDFANINGKKALIEVFGSYWHNGENPQETIGHYSEYGFQCLVIWEHELKDKQAVIATIKAFNG